MKTPKLNKIVKLRWIDSVETEGWISSVSALSQEPLVIETIGYLLAAPSDSEAYWIVCRDWSEDTETVCGVMKIPNVAVVESCIMKASSVK